MFELSSWWELQLFTVLIISDDLRHSLCSFKFCPGTIVGHRPRRSRSLGSRRCRFLKKSAAAVEERAAVHQSAAAAAKEHAEVHQSAAKERAAVHQSAVTAAAEERAAVHQLERRMLSGRRRLRGPRKSHRHQQPALFFWQTMGNFSRLSH